MANHIEPDDQNVSDWSATKYVLRGIVCVVSNMLFLPSPIADRHTAFLKRLTLMITVSLISSRDYNIATDEMQTNKQTKNT